jgi:hypothetical protein
MTVRERIEQYIDRPSVRRYGAFLLAYAAFEILSFNGFLLPQLSTALFFGTILAAAILAAVRPGAAMLLLLAELFVGSQGGYLFAYGTQDSGLQISLRIGLFLAVVGVWFAKTAATLVTRDAERKKAAFAWWTSLRTSGLAWPYLAVLATVAIGAVRGTMLGNGFMNVFFDGNAYVFLALLPAMIAAVGRAEFRKNLVPLFLAAFTSSVLKALIVFYLFTHRIYDVARVVYIWVRDTRVGEITIQVGDFHRVFFQAHVFAIMAVFGAVLFVAMTPKWRASFSAKTALWFLSATFAMIVLGLSRSFLFGGFVGALALIVLLAYSRTEAKVYGRIVSTGLASLVLGIAIVIGTYSIPFPDKTRDVQFASFLGGRAFSFAGEAAANSRWNLLPILNAAGMEHPVLGSGLGRTVTYVTEDPRLLVDNPTGEYTTFAFEWGYHDLWVKFGFLGLAAWGWFLWVLLKPFWARFRALSRLGALRTPADGPATREAILVAGALCGVIALLATHLFSPYLNHPLGIGLLFLVAGYGVGFKEPGTNQ